MGGILLLLSSGRNDKEAAWELIIGGITFCSGWSQNAAGGSGKNRGYVRAPCGGSRDSRCQGWMKMEGCSVGLEELRF